MSDVTVSIQNRTDYNKMLLQALLSPYRDTERELKIMYLIVLLFSCLQLASRRDYGRKDVLEHWNPKMQIVSTFQSVMMMVPSRKSSVINRREDAGVLIARVMNDLEHVLDL